MAFLKEIAKEHDDVSTLLDGRPRYVRATPAKRQRQCVSVPEFTNGIGQLLTLSEGMKHRFHNNDEKPLDSDAENDTEII